VSATVATCFCENCTTNSASTSTLRFVPNFHIDLRTPSTQLLFAEAVVVVHRTKLFEPFTYRRALSIGRVRNRKKAITRAAATTILRSVLLENACVDESMSIRMTTTTTKSYVKNERGNRRK
jgi:hypothetical protein